MSASSNTFSLTAKRYYRLAKPGIIYGNVITTIASFLFASRWHFAPLLFIDTVLGISFVIASAAVFNNILDRDIDANMPRTKEREMPTGVISRRAAYLYARILLILGMALLFFLVNPFTAAVALFGFFTYVLMYTPTKRVTSWAAIIGSIPGAVPIVVGYTAVVGKIDGAAVILFLILTFWQLPHFYAIAIRRKDDYAAAGIPVLPARIGVRATVAHIVGTILLYIVAAASLTIFGYANYVYLILVVGVGLVWLFLASKALVLIRLKDSEVNREAIKNWAKSIFLFSLIVLLSFCVTLALEEFLK